MPVGRWAAWIGARRVDLLWLLVMAALAGLASTRPRHSGWEFLAFGALAAVQIAEMRFPMFRRHWGALASVGAKLGLAWVLVGATEGIESSYYLIFLLPVVTAASTLGLAWTLTTTVVSSAAYLSFLVFVWDRYELDTGSERELAIRVLYLFMTGILLNHFVSQSRRQAERYRKVAEELGEAQAQVRRSERLAALGQLTAGLAHELRNPMGVIRGSAELLAKNVSAENAVAREMASVIAGEVDRTDALVRRFLEFARPSPLRPARNDLRAAVESAVAELRRTVPAERNGVRVETDLAGVLGPFRFDRELMERVFFNLLLNGAEAMPNGGTLRVTARRREEEAEVEVSDTGEGIASENLESIFNPFFTTKPKGVGLGLAIVSKIVAEHGGRIAVASEPGRGTTFKVSLPLGSAV